MRRGKASGGKRISNTRNGRSRRGPIAANARSHRRLRIEPLEDRRLLAIIVDTLVDENDGVGVGGISLRDAIAAAPAGETIEFAPALNTAGPATILLTRGEMRIDKDLTIDGPGAALLTIDASGNDPTPEVNNGNGSRLFQITDGANTLKTVTIRNLTLTGGDASGPGGAILARENLTLVDCIVTGNSTNTNSQLGGGGIYSASNSAAPNSLSLVGCTITNNSAARDEGGGIRKRYGSLVMERCVVNGNTASTYGGGLSGADGGAQIQIRSTTFSENTTTQFSGGGIFTYSAFLTLVDSTVSGNSAGWGAGVYLRAASQGTVENSAIINNVAEVDGGGINLNESQLTLIGCTVSGNSANGYGGGAAVPDGTLVMKHCTVTGNRANADNTGTQQGGGVILGTTSTLTLDHTIVARNIRGVSTRNDVIGPVAARFSLIGDSTGAALFNNGGNLVGSSSSPIDPRLSPLAHNGGPTVTHALLPSSPAIGIGDSAAMAGAGGVPTFDQRGAPSSRVGGGRIDIGAFERQPNPLTGDYNFNGIVDAADYVVWRKTLNSAVDLRADGDGSGMTDQDDFDVWQTNFGKTTGATSALMDLDAEDPHPLDNSRPLPEGEVQNVPLAPNDGGSGMSAFVPPPVVVTPTNPIQTVRVIVLNYEPTVPSMGNRTLWDIFGWSDPREMAAGFVSDVESASGGAIDYQIVDWRDLNEFPLFTDGFRYTADQYVQNRMTNTGWNDSPSDFYTIAEQQGLAQLVNDNLIDEIWMFGDHFFNLLGEAWMAGPASFFVNGPTFPDFPVERAVAGFGFSYERGVAEMIHNLGHRTENHGSRAYGGWNIANPVTPWDYFTANVAQTNRTSFGIGSTHYPFNGTSDYDYANTATVNSYADDFVQNFPNHTYAAVPLSRDAWGDLGTGDWHRAYQKWFFGHVPRADGIAADGRQNNWYKYIYDFNAYRENTGLARNNEAILGATPLTDAGAANYEFTLRYYDVQGIDPATLDSADVMVTGSGGFSQLATLVEVESPQATTAGSARTVRYRITAPGGTWDAADSGTYTVSLRASQVRDTNGTFLPATNLGSFQVNITDNMRLDVAAMLATGDATVTATTWDIGGPAAIFDDSTSSLYRTPNINPAVVTLSFTASQTVTGFRTFFSGGPNRWKVEAADSIDDLNSQTGTYQLLVPLTNTPSDVFSIATLGAPASAKHLRLTAERLTGDDYVHINSWDLFGPAVADTAVPTATLLTAPAALPGDASTSFLVRYNDDAAVDVRSINFGDIRVTGPNDFVQTAAFYGVNVNANGTIRDAQYFVSAPGGSWDYTENGTYVLELVPDQVFDTAGKPVAAFTLASFVVSAPLPETRPKVDMTELNAADWFAAAEGATASTSDDTTRKMLGAASVRFDTTGGFDTYLRYEPAAGAIWDLTSASEFHFSVYAQNPSPNGFQQEPIIRFIDGDGDAMEFRYYRNNSPNALWNDARGQWISSTIPIKSTAQPATGWRGTAKGTPDWSRMRTVEIHADTWDAGFTLWFDGAGFNLPPLPGDYNGNQAVDAADYVLWRKTLGSNSDLRADGNANGTVDQADLNVWRANFGATLPALGNSESATAAAVIDEAHPLAATSRGPMARRRTAATMPSIAQRDDALLAWVAAHRNRSDSVFRDDDDLLHRPGLLPAVRSAGLDAAFELLAHGGL